MIIKVNQAPYFKFKLLFYSKLTERSVYLNSYFFSLKFLVTSAVWESSFYFLSKSFYNLIQNYISYYDRIFLFNKYLYINNKILNSTNFLYLLFNKTLNKQHVIAKLI